MSAADRKQRRAASLAWAKSVGPPPLSVLASDQPLPVQAMAGGHGHVVPRPDGGRARCGGPAICAACALEKAHEDQRIATEAAERLCPSCHKPYVKGEPQPCSNGFHCCRDCEWREGRRVKLCDWHKAKKAGRRA